MLDAARRATGLSDFGDAWFLCPLSAWAPDLREPHLNDFGRGFLRSLAVREHPEIDEMPIPPVVYITRAAALGTDGDGVGLLGQAAGLCMPRWWRFLSDEDLTPAYANYRRVVQLLLWQRPVGPGGFLVRKASQIARHIESFARAFPEARFVVTDRDPYRCLASMVMMGHAIVEPFCSANPLTGDGVRGGLALGNVDAKLAALDVFADAHPERVHRVAYPALVADGAATAEHLFAALGIAEDDALAPRRVDAQGYEHESVLADPRSAAYCARHAIAPERERLH